MTIKEKIIILTAVAVIIGICVFFIVCADKIIDKIADRTIEIEDKEKIHELKKGEADYPLSVVLQLPQEPSEAEAEEPIEAELEAVKVDEYLVTAYCPCVSCSGQYGNSTATGTVATEGRTIAADPNVIPYGTEVIIEGMEGTYVVEDCGGLIKGKRLDLYYESHEAAKAWGAQTKEVKIKL